MIKMVLIHDLGESIIGDHTPESIEIEEKKKIENNAIRRILSRLPNEKIKKEYLEIWKEFEDNKTDVSKKVHLIDKLEMAIQARYYLDNYPKISKKDVKPFFDSALRYIINNTKKNIKEDSDIVTEIEKMDEIEQILLYLNK
jgi:putative hydrolase of HD superfamily